MSCCERFLLTGAVLVCLTSAAEAQSTLNGRVVSDSGTPIAGATITLMSIRYTVKSDSLGRFALSGTPGSTLNLSLEAPGFRGDSTAVVLTRGRPVTRDFVLVSEATLLPEANPSDRVLRGRVLTPEGDPISYANIQVNGGRRYVTDDSGRFSVPTPYEGRLTILARRIGFEPEEVKLEAMPDTAVRMRMRAVARMLPGQVVTGRTPFRSLDLGGFYRRMNDVEHRAQVGYFVTPEDLELRKPLNVTDAVEQFPNIRLRPIRDQYGGGIPLNRDMRIEDRSGCPFTVYLDRVRIQPTMVGGKAMDTRINELVQPNSVSGIEVYPRAAGAPPEFPSVERQGDCNAGVVVIWSK